MVKKIEQLRTNTAVKESRKTPTAQAVRQEGFNVHSAQGELGCLMQHAESELDSAHNDFVRARDRLLDAAGFGASRSWPDWVRTVCAYIAAFCTGYGIGMIFVTLMEMVAIAVASNTLFVVIYVIGLAIAFALAYKLGGYIGGAIGSGAVDGFIADKYTAARGWVGSIFDRREISCA